MRSIGQVLTNGKINHSLVVMGTLKRDALYALPMGLYLEMMRKARRGDIVWTFLDNNNASNLLSKGHYNTLGSNIDTDTVQGLVSINGQGTKGADNYEFMSHIQPLGIALIENDKNETDRFNLHFGGIDTVINNGNQRINAGDWVCAYAPSLAERFEGGRGDECDKNGLMTLWFKPYPVFKAIS